jgi:hypothetical protein
MVRSLLPLRRVESNGARGHGDGVGVVFVSFTAAGHPHQWNGSHPFRCQAAARLPLLRRSAHPKIISFGIQLKQVQRSNKVMFISQLNNAKGSTYLIEVACIQYVLMT